MSAIPSIKSWGCLLREQVKRRGYTITYSRPQLVNGGLSPPPSKHYPGIVCYMVILTVNNSDFYGFGPSPSLARHYAEFETFNSLNHLPSELVKEVCSSMSFKDGLMDGEDGEDCLDPELDNLSVSKSGDHECSVECSNVNELILSPNLYHESGPNPSSESLNDIDIAIKPDVILPPRLFVQDVSPSSIDGGNHPLSYSPKSDTSQSPPNSNQLKVPSSFAEYHAVLEKPPPLPRPFDPSVWDHRHLPSNNLNVVGKLLEVAKKKGMHVRFDYKTFGPKYSKVISVEAKAGGFVFQGSGVKFHIAKSEAASKLLQALQQLPYPSLNEVGAVKPRADPHSISNSPPHTMSPTNHIPAPPIHYIPATPTHFSPATPTNHISAPPIHYISGHPVQHTSYNQRLHPTFQQIQPTQHTHLMNRPPSPYQPFPYGPPPTYQKATPPPQHQMPFSSYSHMERVKDVCTESDSDSDCEKVSSGLLEVIPHDLCHQKPHVQGFVHDQQYIDRRAYPPNRPLFVEHPVQSEYHSKESHDVMTQVLAVEHMALSDPLHFVTRLPQARKTSWSSSVKDNFPSHSTSSDKPSWRRIRYNYLNSNKTTHPTSKTLSTRTREIDSNMPHSPQVNKRETGSKDRILRVIACANPSSIPIPESEPEEAVDRSPLVPRNNHLLSKCEEDKESSFKSHPSIVSKNMSYSTSDRVIGMDARVETDISCHGGIEKACIVSRSPTVDFKGEASHLTQALGHSSRNSRYVVTINKDGDPEATNEMLPGGNCHQLEMNLESESNKFELETTSVKHGVTEKPAFQQVLLTASDGHIKHTVNQLPTVGHATPVQTSTSNNEIKQAESGIVSVKVPPPCRQQSKSEKKKVGGNSSGARDKPEEISFESSPEDKETANVLSQSLTMDSKKVIKSTTTSVRQLPMHPLLARYKNCRRASKWHMKHLDSDVSSFISDDSKAIVRSSSSEPDSLLSSGSEGAHQLECLSDRKNGKYGSNFFRCNTPSVFSGVGDLGQADNDSDCASQTSADKCNVSSQDFILKASTSGSVGWHLLENCSVSLPSEGSLKSLEAIFDSN